MRRSNFALRVPPTLLAEGAQGRRIGRCGSQPTDHAGTRGKGFCYAHGGVL